MESGTKDQGVVFSSNATNCAGAHELTGGECIYRQDARAYTPARYVGLENVLVRDTLLVVWWLYYCSTGFVSQCKKDVQTVRLSSFVHFNLVLLPPCDYDIVSSRFNLIFPLSHFTVIHSFLCVTYNNTKKHSNLECIFIVHYIQKCKIISHYFLVCDCVRNLISRNIFSIYVRIL